MRITDHTDHPWHVERFDLGARSLFFVVRGPLGSREVFRKTESRYVAFCFANSLNARKA